MIGMFREYFVPRREFYTTEANMAYLECNFMAESIGMASTMNVLVPEREPPSEGWACLYLLHGLSDDHSMWQRRTSIERYVAQLDLVVVMPCVHRSFYTNMVSGYRYWDFISEELPRIVGNLFHVSGVREKTFAAGLSMGGYGAFKLALAHPDRYMAAASLSGALDLISHKPEDDSPIARDVELVFGCNENIPGSKHDLMTCAGDLAATSGPKPALYQCCGTDDFLYEGNVRFRHHAEDLGLPLTYEEGPGDHNWEYWGRQIRRVLEWLPLGM